MNTKAIVSKYDMRRNPVYQIDYTNESVGKLISSSKRRVTWKFGFSDRKAIATGRTGPDCRGEEHEIVMVWSVVSGKCRITYDGKELFVSVNSKMDLKFETTWNIPGTSHYVKIIANAMPSFSADPKFKQYDFLLDGMSFFEMPLIYELGLKKSYSKEHYPDARKLSNEAGSPPRIRAILAEFPSPLTKAHPVTTNEIIAFSENKMVVNTPIHSNKSKAANDAVDLIDFFSLPGTAAKQQPSPSLRYEAANTPNFGQRQSDIRTYQELMSFFPPNLAIGSTGALVPYAPPASRQNGSYSSAPHQMAYSGPAAFALRTGFPPNAYAPSPTYKIH